MSATARTPITRNLTLVALIVAAGVFSLRLLDTVQAPLPAAPVGSLQEKEVTALLETVAGPGNVRVSVHGGAEKHWLVLLNGAEDSTQTQKIESILTAATGFRSGLDTLTLSEFEFAAAETARMPYQAALELTGLGLLVLILGGLALRPENKTETDLQESLRTPMVSPPQANQTAHQLHQTDPAIERAALMAETNPEGTVRLLRTWMTDKTGGTG